MTSRRIAKSFQVVSDGDMSSDVTSQVTAINYLDNIGYQLVWTGTPTGTFTVEVQLEGSETWTTLTLSSTISASGSADNYYINLNQLPATSVRLKYTAGSGSGTLNAWVKAMAIGG